MQLPWKLVSFLAQFALHNEVLYVNLTAGTAVRRTPPVKQAATVRLVLISDTHTHHRVLNLPAGDVLIHCGDALVQQHEDTQQWQSSRTKLSEFFNWLGAQQFESVLFCAGNHEIGNQQQGLTNEQIASLSLEAHVLNGQQLRLPHGIKVTGSPFSSPSWNPGELQEVKVPEGSDILVTHNQLDSDFLQSDARLHVFGHIHQEYGAQFHQGKCIINCSSCTEFMCLTRPPIVVDFPLAI